MRKNRSGFRKFARKLDGHVEEDLGDTSGFYYHSRITRRYAEGKLPIVDSWLKGNYSELVCSLFLWSNTPQHLMNTWVALSGRQPLAQDDFNEAVRYVKWYKRLLESKL